MPIEDGFLLPKGSKYYRETKANRMLACLVELKEFLEVDDPNLGGTGEVRKELADRGFDEETIEMMFDCYEELVKVYMGVENG